MIIKRSVSEQGEDPTLAVAIQENTSRNTHNVVEELLMAEEEMRTVLDIPCGEGAFTQRLLRRGVAVQAGDFEDIIGVSGADFVRCDMNVSLPFPDELFDGVACIDGIEHIERPFDFVREVRRVLRPGGTFVLSTPNISALRSRWRWLLSGFHNKGKTPLDEVRPTLLHHIGLKSFPDLRYMLHTNGFEITNIRCNRIKPISWLYAPLVPLTWVVTALIFNREEQHSEQRLRNREILRQLFSKPVLFGETLILKARRV
ncbi:MAG TPA: class I SAM-dependent methyltransferase [Acidobacteria bacterium]|nr:class I SAM-dependent methyltransferase [Acidobacteriota bacterium]